MQLNLGGSTISFENQPGDFPANRNPFAVNNNKWRMAPGHKETDEELKQRLINHLQFWQLYFEWALDNDVSILDVRSMASPVKLYGNGIGIRRSYEVPAAWRSYFYDSTDSEKARDMLKEVFRKNDIKWPETQNNFELFLSAFQQIEYHLKK